ncbi:hypothetical protein Btru_020610 [Bulinus truncatus]|nr:hypothetical protein Btru_020610 [Bulinus truncatus]
MSSKRLATFESWPKEKHLTAQELSEAGFLYTGVSDRVRCFWCNVELHEWEAGDSPWVEHARFSPECQYVIKEMGQFLIEKSKELSSNQDRISYGIVVNKIPAARFVARCAESGACHYHEAGRRCAEKSCAGIKDKPKYPRYIKHSSRLATFVPGSRYENMKHMIADAGYFYDNKSFCCFHCGDKKFTINPNDVLMVEHTKTSPQCGYIRRQIGDEFIHIIQELLKSYDMGLI